MELLLSALKKLPEYGRILSAIAQNQAAGVSGAAQINRSHLIASLLHETKRPALIVCQDELAARRTQSELAAFLGTEAPILPSRDLTFYNASAISRGWEHQRLRQLYDLARGTVRIQIATWEALALRTMPKALLFSSALTLKPGAVIPLEELSARLVRLGYTRCALVEGVGQFSVRGGILDVFSPACDRPVRVEFFGDEVDAMGCFDPVTQRRTENVDGLTLLPVA